jgi:hypothetical protein
MKVREPMEVFDPLPSGRAMAFNFGTPHIVCCILMS